MYLHKNPTPCQIVHKIDIAIQKIVRPQIYNCFPADLIEDNVAWLALELIDLVEDDLHRSRPGVGKFVARNFSPYCGGDGKFFLELPPQGHSKLLSGFDLTAREFPFAGVLLTRLSLADQNRGILHDNGGDDAHRRIGAKIEAGGT